MTLLDSAQGETLVLNLCVGLVVNGCFTADMEPCAFICGKNLTVLETVVWETETQLHT